VGCIALQKMGNHSFHLIIVIVDDGRFVASKRIYDDFSSTDSAGVK